ncbi:amidohydrolase family protein [Methylobacterium sp. NEAU 140]|uniref:amidohydrolase family protein n=1 Tax=Methylobacterium sp. NEAU 140 TaxID=3064945 RepID=UPI002734F0B5|nr:amidohydrolase family protein [Methylobacterium sp. NEAU 140]MDP4026863.1 amidohydrolase family protein [Methylobacterium sp. NEAU 140]
MAGPSTPYDGPIVDAHHHLWDPRINHHPWLTPEGRIPFRYGDYTAICRPYRPDDYRADARGHPVVAGVYVETEWDPTDPIGETRYASGLAAAHGLPNAIVAQAWLDAPDAAAVLAGQAAFPLVRSVRHKPGGPDSPGQVGRARTLMSDPRWRDGFARLERHGLHFDLQTPWWNLPEAEALARDFPGTLIVLNHTGLPADRSPEGLAGWRAALGRFAECPNARVKISGLGLPGRPWTVADNAGIVRDAMAMFGPDRAMFASNFPVDSLCATFDAVFSGFKAIVADRDPADQRALFHDTARAVYRPAPPLDTQPAAAGRGDPA